jgi:hypothetical protein
VYVGSLDGGQPSKLLAADSSVVYAPQGYLLYAQGGMLMAQPFSAATLKTTDGPFVVSDKVEQVGDVGPSALGVFTIAGNGLLVYSAQETVLNELAWFDRGGKRLAAFGGPADYAEMWLSPDQTEAIVARSSDLWVVNFVRGTSSRVTFQADDEVSPIWSPDGRVIVYALAREGTLAVMPAMGGGGGVTQQLLKIPGTELYPDDWSRDGRTILFEHFDSQDRADIWAMPAPVLRTDGTFAPFDKPFPVLASPSFNEGHAQLSPDGKWIAYGSDESGRPEIYVQSFPPGKGKWPVSSEGGDQVTWRRDGRELYYLTPDKRLVAVEVQTTPTFQIGASTKLFLTAVPTTGLLEARNNYVPRADGQRFLISSLTRPAGATPLRVMLDWTAGR